MAWAPPLAYNVCAVSRDRTNAYNEITLSSVMRLDHLLSLTLLDPVDLGSEWLRKCEWNVHLPHSPSAHISTSPAWADMVEKRTGKR